MSAAFLVRDVVMCRRKASDVFDQVTIVDKESTENGPRYKVRFRGKDRASWIPPGDVESRLRKCNNEDHKKLSKKGNINLHVVNTSPPLALSVPRSYRMVKVRRVVAGRLNIPIITVRLAYRGRTINDDDTIPGLGLEDESEIEVVLEESHEAGVRVERDASAMVASSTSPSSSGSVESRHNVVDDRNTTLTEAVQKEEEDMKEEMDLLEGGFSIVGSVEALEEARASVVDDDDFKSFNGSLFDVLEDEDVKMEQETSGVFLPVIDVNSGCSHIVDMTGLTTVGDLRRQHASNLSMQGVQADDFDLALHGVGGRRWLKDDDELDSLNIDDGDRIEAHPKREWAITVDPIVADPALTEAVAAGAVVSPTVSSSSTDTLGASEDSLGGADGTVENMEEKDLRETAGAVQKTIGDDDETNVDTVKEARDKSVSDASHPSQKYCASPSTGIIEADATIRPSFPDSAAIYAAALAKTSPFFPAKVDAAEVKKNEVAIGAPLQQPGSTGNETVENTRESVASDDVVSGSSLPTAGIVAADCTSGAEVDAADDTMVDDAEEKRNEVLTFNAPAPDAPLHSADGSGETVVDTVEGEELSDMVSPDTAVLKPQEDASSIAAVTPAATDASTLAAPAAAAAEDPAISNLSPLQIESVEAGQHDSGMLDNVPVTSGSGQAPPGKKRRRRKNQWSNMYLPFALNNRKTYYKKRKWTPAEKAANARKAVETRMRNAAERQRKREEQEEKQEMSGAEADAADEANPESSSRPHRARILPVRYQDLVPAATAAAASAAPGGSSTKDNRSNGTIRKRGRPPAASTTPAKRVRHRKSTTTASSDSSQTTTSANDVEDTVITGTSEGEASTPPPAVVDAEAYEMDHCYLARLPILDSPRRLDDVAQGASVASHVDAAPPPPPSFAAPDSTISPRRITPQSGTLVVRGHSAMPPHHAPIRLVPAGRQAQSLLPPHLRFPIRPAQAVAPIVPRPAVSTDQLTPAGLCNGPASAARPAAPIVQQLLQPQRPVPASLMTAPVPQPTPLAPPAQAPAEHIVPTPQATVAARVPRPELEGFHRLFQQCYDTLRNPVQRMVFMGEAAKTVESLARECGAELPADLQL